MIALDTNALVRMLVEDDTEQAKIVQQLVSFAEQKSITVLILPEVLLETVWVLESVYTIKRAEIIKVLHALLAASTFAISHDSVVRSAIRQFQRGFDFADALIAGHAKKEKAQALFSFDRRLSAAFRKLFIVILRESKNAFDRLSEEHPPLADLRSALPMATLEAKASSITLLEATDSPRSFRFPATFL